MSENLNIPERKATQEQAAWLYDCLQQRLGDQPGNEKFYRTDRGRFVDAFVWETEPILYYGIADGLYLPDAHLYLVTANSITEYIWVTDPEDPNSGEDQYLQPTEAEIAELMKVLEQNNEVSLADFHNYFVNVRADNPL